MRNSPRHRSGLGQPAPAAPIAPAFTLQCDRCPIPLGLPLLCREELRRLILLACQLASRAAHRLETAPAATGGVFKDFFADHPSRPVPGAGNQTAGRIVASRLRQAEKDLRLRGTRYKCDRCDAGSRAEAASMGGITDAYAIAFPTKNEVWLCPDFWALPDRFQQAGILLHEMCHLSFHPLFRHDAAETKGTSAYCYEGFVLQVQGHAPDAVVRTKCRSTRVN